MAIIDVVQWQGTPDIFAWRFPEDNLSTWTQLIVNQSQEAVLFRKGALLARFGAGKHTLSTENIPLLENLYGIPFGGKNPFTAEVWFVNKVFSLDIKWGTQQPFQIRDPEFGVMVPVRAFGQFGIRIDDAEAFLVKLVGTLPVFDKTRLTDYFRGLLMSRATSVIASAIGKEKVSALNIAAQTTQLSEALHQAMQDEFAAYGIGLVNFYISQISVPEDDPAVAKLKSALAKRAEMDILGYNYQQERSYDVLGDAARNEGMAGTMMGAGMGLGMGLGMGGTVGRMMSDTIAPNVQPQPAAACPSCGTAVAPGIRFCPGCGKPAAATPQQQVVCDKCGKPIPAGSQFCPHCGDTYNPCPKCKADVPQGAAVCPACGEPMPSKCPSCGAGVPAAAHFCSACGKEMRHACPGCGCETAPGASFCPKCGTKLEK